MDIEVRINTSGILGPTPTSDGSGHWIKGTPEQLRTFLRLAAKEVDRAAGHEQDTLGEFLHERRIPGVPCGIEH